MSKPYETHLFKIGNSQGIRIPKVLLQQVNLTGKLSIEVVDNSLVLRQVSSTRQGWDAAFKQMANNNDDQLLDTAPLSTDWEDEWQWSCE
jgi:antitoxin MazE